MKPMSEQQAVVIRDYHVNIRAILQEAWQKVEGVKWTIIATLLMIFFLSLLLTFLISYVTHLPFGGQKGTWAGSIIPKVAMIPIIPLIYGIGLLGIYRAGGLPISIKVVFQQYHKFLPLLFYYLILSGIGFAFDGIGIMVRSQVVVILVMVVEFLLTLFLMMSPWLILEKNCDVFIALKTSIMGIKQHWLKIILYLLTLIPIVAIPFAVSFAGIMLGNALLIGAGIVVIIISYIWIMPMVTIATGILYREMFGVTTTTET
jgi:hypothetical protein